jgi:3-(3-hydroxy-phenyl)propionate hydroxylase
VSVYTFQCRRLARFVHGPVIFCGDSAHVVSPFGARGGNGGLQDVDALGWRLAHVAQGGDAGVLNAYDRERQHGADENLLNSSRTTRFMSPAPGAERLFRDAVLALAGKAAFARPLVNSGRLSRPCVYPLAGPDDPALPVEARPGAVAPDAPLADGWLIDRLGRRPVLLALGQPAPEGTGAERLELALTPELQARYLGGAEQALYLVRPDQIIAARWVTTRPEAITEALTAIWSDRT